MKVKLTFVFLLILGLFLSGCGGPAVPQINNALKPTVPPTDGSSGIVTGQVLTNDTNKPITQTPIYLAQIHWDSEHKGAAYVLNQSQSPATLTNKDGFFTFTTVPPDEYALIVGRYDGNSDVVREKNGDARIYKIDAGKIVDAGVVQVNSIVQSTTP